MIDTVGWIITINTIIICITCYKCRWLNIDHLDNRLREEIRQFDIKMGEEVDKGYE